MPQDPRSFLTTPDRGGYSPLNRLRSHLAGNTTGRRTMVDRDTVIALAAVVEKSLMAKDGTFYVYAEDMAAALVGPFQDREAAQAHIGLCETRGDGAAMKVLTAEQAAEERPTIGIELSVEEDVLDSLAMAARAYASAHRNAHQPFPGDQKLMAAALAAVDRLEASKAYKAARS